MILKRSSKNILAFMACILAVLSTYAQKPISDVEFVIEKIKVNYPGFKIKTNQNDFDRIVKETMNRYPGDTFRALSLVVNSFMDQHMRIYLRKKFIDVDTAACALRFQNAVSRLNEKKALRRFEGYWKDDNNSCVVGILHKEGHRKDYEAIIVECRSNQLLQGEILAKMDWLSNDMYLTDFRNSGTGSRCFVNSKFRNDSILITGVEGKWRRLSNYNPTFPILGSLKARIDTATGALIDSTTYLVSIPSSSANNIKIVERIFEMDSSLIANARNLIIDIRGNNGGKSAVFDPIYPWIYTNPIIDVCGDMYSSVDGNEQYIKKIESMKKSNLLTEEEIQYADFKIDKLTAHIGEFVQSVPDTFTLPEVRKCPKKVGIIVDYACQSAAEMFILNAMQSQKTVLFGEPSRGAIDYLDFYPVNTPSNAMVLFMPVTKRRVVKGGELDGKGIKPHVLIADNQPNWINYAKEYLSNF